MAISRRSRRFGTHKVDECAQYRRHVAARRVIQARFDPATGMGLQRRSEDFGQTLGRWGVGSGPYLVLPLLGPSTARDGVALAVDRAGAPAALVGGGSTAYWITAVDAVERRAGLLGATDLLDEIALDKYSLVREAYLARRHDAVQDGATHNQPTTRE